MPRKNVDCDQCQKQIRGEEIAYFSDLENDLDFCSEECCLKWNEEENWEDINKNFTEELKKEWKRWGFSYEKAKEWADSFQERFGVNDYFFYAWLRDEKNMAAEEISVKNNLEELFNEFKLWIWQKTIHSDFTLELQKEWEKEGFTPEECKKWLEVGLESKEFYLTTYLKKKGYDFQSEMNLKELRNEYIAYYNKGQGWLDKNYPIEERGKIEEIHLTEPSLEGELDLGSFTKLWKIFISSQVDETKITFKNKPLEIVIFFQDAQKWLESQEQYNTKEKREKTEEFSTGNWNKKGNVLTWRSVWKELEGNLDLNDFINLKKLDCSWNKLTSLDLTNCEQLDKIECHDNQLINLSLPKNCPNLTELDIRNNNLFGSDLSIFSPFANLEVLKIGTGVKEYKWKSEYEHFEPHKTLIKNRKKEVEQGTKQGICNHFYGSLEPLKNLSKLRELDIRNTDINSGWEYLPTSIEKINYSSEERPESKIQEIAEPLNWILSKQISGQQLKAWIDFGLSLNDCGFAVYLAKQGYTPQSSFNLEELKESYYNKSKENQKWLDKNYPKERQIKYGEYGKKIERSEVEKIYLNEADLEGELDLEDFTYRQGVKVLISTQVDETKLVFRNKPEGIKVIKTVQAQQWLEKQAEYNAKEQREKIEELNISNQNLEGKLVLNNFSDLKKLNCSQNQLTNLDLTSCEKLEEIGCYSNSLINIILPTNHTNLKKLDLNSNNFPNQDLSFLVPYSNLEELELRNNNFTGSLDCLSNMRQLKRLYISNTDLNEININKLPSSLEWIRYSVDRRPDCKLVNIIPQLEKYGEYGRCQTCQKPRTGYRWCQPCAEKEWQKDIKNLTGQEVVKKFIQKKPGREFGVGELQWIPYEEFTDIEYLAEGGFSKIYKAKCKKIKRYYGYAGSEDVALKSLNNSQNMTLDFLTEVINNKLTAYNIVRCHGISQDPVTKNYVMIMDYMSRGNLRKYLQNRDIWSNNYIKSRILRNKLDLLKDIAKGLNTIHEQNLIHRDLHSGNVLNKEGPSHISDLGISRPVNFQKEEGKIFGVLPYVAPEVLQDNPYTKASDIYSFGIIAYELFANAYPYTDLKILYPELKDEDELKKAFILDVCCNKLHPSIDKLKIPQLLKDLIKKCWNVNPRQRPSSRELYEIIYRWWGEIIDEKKTLFYQQYQTIKDEYNHFSANTLYRIYPQTITHSQPINTKQIAQLFKKSEEQALELEIKKIEQEINQSFTDKQKRLVSNFIQIYKKREKGNREITKKDIKNLKDELRENNFLDDEKIKKIVEYCIRLIDSEKQLQAQEINADK